MASRGDRSVGQAARVEDNTAQRRLTFLTEAGRILISSLDYDVTMQQVTRLAVPLLGDVCFFDLPVDGDRLEHIACAHTDPGQQAAKQTARLLPLPNHPAHPITTALRRGQTIVAHEIHDTWLDAALSQEHHRIMRGRAFHAVMAVPLIARDRVIGVLTCGLIDPARHYSPQDQELAEELARRAATALDNARLVAKVEAERDRLQQVLDVLPAAILIADATPTFLIGNRVAREILGVDPAGQPVPVADDDAYASFGTRRLDGTPYNSPNLPLLRAILGGEVVSADQFLIRNAADDRDIPVLANAAPLHDASGAVSGGVVVFQDITAIRALEHSRDEFVSSIAHDLKSPLTAIRGQAQLARRRVTRLADPNAPNVLENLVQIDASTQRLVRLIDELVDATRTQMGQALELRRQPTDLVALVRSVVAQQGATAHHLSVESDLSELSASVDANRLERVVVNLLSNAVKYSPNGSTVSVRIDRENGPAGPQAVIAVTDRGAGIPAEDLPHIFKRFRHAGNVVGHIVGTGIGLASARSIVEQHGGSISAESAVGRGSTFIVRLPIDPAPAP